MNVSELHRIKDDMGQWQQYFKMSQLVLNFL